MNLCNIYGAKVDFLFKKEILFKYLISYFKCKNCGFIQTEKSHWLKEAYSEAISKSDIGLVFRNAGIYTKITSLIETFFDKSKKFLDYGGGYGMLVRLMRDEGYDALASKISGIKRMRIEKR